MWLTSRLVSSDGMKPRKKAGLDVVGSQAFHIKRIVDAGVARVKPNKAIRSLCRRLKLVGAVVGVNEFQLRLLRIASKRIPALQHLQAAHGQSESFHFSGGAVTHGRVAARQNQRQVVIVTAKPGATRENHQQGQQQCAGKEFARGQDQSSTVVHSGPVV